MTSTAVKVLVTEPIRNRRVGVQRAALPVPPTWNVHSGRSARCSATESAGTRASAWTCRTIRSRRRCGPSTGLTSAGQHRAERPAAEHVRVHVEDLLAAVLRRC